MTKMLNEAYKRELDKFFRERVAHAWDAMITRQQEALLALGVPTMYATNVKGEREVSSPLRTANILRVTNNIPIGSVSNA
jgi:hypothetical protein